MRSIWKGDLSFGLVNVPVKVYSATESHDRRSHQVDSSDGTRIRYRRVREGTDTEVDYSSIANAYEADNGETVIVTKEDLASLPVQKSPEIAILEFVPADQVDPIYFDKPYYLEPSSKSPKAYTLLTRALAETERLAIATFTLRNRTRLAALRVVGNVMTLQTLLWPDEVRAPDFEFLGDDITIRDQEMQMASSLIDSMAKDFDPDEFGDTYQAELSKLIEAKAEGGEAFPETAEADTTDDDSEVADLLAALRASVRDRDDDGQAGDAKADDSKGAPSGPAKKAPAKKSASKSAATKSAATKSATTKSTAKKAPAKKAAKSTSAEKADTEKADTEKSGTAKSAAKKAPAKKAARKAAS